MPSPTVSTEHELLRKPRLRGVFHQLGFVVAVPLGFLLAAIADGARARTAAAVFAAAIAAMFGASAFYHRRNWTPARQRWLQRLDHAGIYGAIAGTYTPFGLLVLAGAWRIVVLAIVWSGAVVAMLLKLVWVDSPRWIAAALGVGLGWVGVVVLPQLVEVLGVTPSLLLLAGGLCYTAGAIVYALRKPDPLPATFGYHELFHVLVVLGVGFQYVVVALFVLPRG